MKAAVVEDAGKVVVRELPEPAMGPYEARCELLYGSVCAGTDTHLVQGHPPFCHWVKRPYILGHESVGRVIAVGAKVRNLKVGDVVTRVGCPGVPGVTAGWGGFAQQGIAKDWQAMQADGVDGWQGVTMQRVIPPDVDPAAGTLFITWRETFSYTKRMGVGPGSSVLVIGSGGNGLAFLSHARNLGATQITMAGSANRAADAKRAGANTYVDYRAQDCWDKVMAAVQGGYDFVIDAVGKAAITAKGQQCLKAGGSIAIYGLDEAGQIALVPGKTFTYYGGGYDEAEVHDEVLALYLAGKLDPAVWHAPGKVFALDDITQALAAVADRSLVKPLVKLQP